MFAKLKGLVDAVGPDEVVLDVSGVGYLVACGQRTLARIPAPGEAVTLHIETYVREDQFRLFGFLSEDERAWFVRLQSVQGVGAKVALALLDILTGAEILEAASNGDAAMVSRANGVGPRLAARIVSELKGKASPTTRYGGMTVSPPVVRSGKAGGRAAGESSASDAGLAVRADAVSALMNLGLQEPDARAAVTNAYARFDDTPKLDALVKAALKEMNR